MGKALRQEHLSFFINRMNEHDRVMNCELIPDDDEYLFRISRRLSPGFNDVIVHLTDVYRYSLAEFLARPNHLKSGSFVVIGMPHARADSHVINRARIHRIGVGDVAKFMGALNSKNIWEYMSPAERNRNT